MTIVIQLTRLAKSAKMSKGDVRKEAYIHVFKNLSKPPVGSYVTDRSPIIPLSEVLTLKECVSNPSTMLIASLKQLLKYTTAETETDTHLVVPLKHHNQYE